MKKKLGKLKKKFEKKRKKKKWGRITVDDWNVCEGTVIPPRGLVYVLMTLLDPFKSPARWYAVEAVGLYKLL
jgi:hypothetical protein